MCLEFACSSRIHSSVLTLIYSVRLLPQRENKLYTISERCSVTLEANLIFIVSTLLLTHYYASLSGT